MTSMPASRSARAMIFAPRSWPSRPGFATTTRILRVEVAAAMGGILARDGRRAPQLAHDQLHLLVGGTVDRADDRVGAGLADDLGVGPRPHGVGAERHRPPGDLDVVPALAAPDPRHLGAL